MTFTFAFTVTLTMETDEVTPDTKKLALEDAQFVLEHTLNEGLNSAFYHKHDQFVVSDAQVLQEVK